MKYNKPVKNIEIVIFCSSIFLNKKAGNKYPAFFIKY